MKSPLINDSDMDHIARLIRESRLAVFFTGAGISTPSGIPDFRSERTGLWNNDNPMEVASLTSFYKTPDRFYRWIKPLAEKIVQSKPNPAHLAVAQMEQKGLVKGVITQNIDHLHQAAGSHLVLELHGNMQTCSCIACDQHYQSSPYLQQLIITNEVPRCPACGEILKPDIVLFEEILPMDTWEKAYQLSRNCDLMIVAGSSLEVIPAATIPMTAVQTGARLVILNRTATHLDDQATIRIQGDLVDVLPHIAERLL